MTGGSALSLQLQTSSSLNIRNKHRKHTAADSSHPVQSVFDEPFVEYYEATMQEAFEHGAMEVTSRGIDILFCPSKQSSIGFKQSYGSHITTQDTVRVVKSTDSLRVHSFLNASSDHSQHLCGVCGGPLFG